MSVTTTEESLATRIEEALRHRFSERSAAAERYGNEFVGLWRAAEEHALGGKLIRPRLLLDLTHALAPAPLNADETRTAIDVAAHVELLHFAFLLHDDVIDGDLMRRRRPNLIGALVAEHAARPTEAALHWARSSAILLGDLLLSSAVLGFARADVMPEARDRLLGLLEQTIFETVAGEHADVALSDGIIAPRSAHDPLHERVQDVDILLRAPAARCSGARRLVDCDRGVSRHDRVAPRPRLSAAG